MGNDSNGWGGPRNGAGSGGRREGAGRPRVRWNSGGPGQRWRVEISSPGGFPKTHTWVVLGIEDGALEFQDVETEQIVSIQPADDFDPQE